MRHDDDDMMHQACDDNIDDVGDIKFDDKGEYKISSPNLHAKKPCGDCGACLAFSDAKQLNVLTVQQRIEAIKEVLRVEKEFNDDRGKGRKRNRPTTNTATKKQ